MTASLESQFNGWRHVLLGDIAEVVGGKPAPQDPRAFSDNGIPFVRMKDLGRHHLTTNLTEVDDRISREFAASKGLTPLRAGAILMPRSGSVALNHRAILGIDAIIVSHICALVADPNAVSNRYLYYYLCTITLDKITKKTTGLDAINFSDLRKLSIPLPPLDEQQRISALLDKADSIHRKRAQALAMVDELPRAAFLEMFGDPAVNSHKYRLQEFGSLLAVPLRNGISPSSLGQVSAEVLTLAAITRGLFDPTQRKEAKFLQPISENDEVSTADFYICRGSGTPDLVGRGLFATRSMAGVAFPDTMIAARPNQDQLMPGFLETIWNSSFVRNQIVNSARTTNGTYKINQTAATNIVFPVPPIEEQGRFQEVVAKIRSIRGRVSANSFGGELFASLAQRAFTGEL